jgi:hypothetical protein
MDHRLALPRRCRIELMREQVRDSPEVVGQIGRTTKTSKRSRPLARQRLVPRPRNSTEMRPSMPTRKRPILATFQGSARPALLAMVHIVGTVKAPIAGVQVGRMQEDLWMTVHRGLSLRRIGGIAIPHLIVGRAQPASAGTHWRFRPCLPVPELDMGMCSRSASCIARHP